MASTVKERTLFHLQMTSHATNWQDYACKDMPEDLFLYYIYQPRAWVITIGTRWICSVSIANDLLKMFVFIYYSITQRSEKILSYQWCLPVFPLKNY